MSRGPKKGRLPSRSNALRQRAVGEVGYGRPPKSGQFKPGQSGNPKGRPKGARNLATNVQAVLSRKINVVDRGRRISMSAAEAILHRYLELAIKGDVKAGAFLLSLLERFQPEEVNESSADVLSERDHEIMQNFLEFIVTKEGANQ